MVTLLQYPELNPMIMRRFSKAGDVETARDLVIKVITTYAFGVETVDLID